MMINTIALSEYLKPLNDFLLDNTVSEILVNQPHIVFVERKGIFQRYEKKELDFHHLLGLAQLMARFSDQRLSEKEPLLSGILPTGHRLQIVLPPATSKGRIVIAIRKQTIENMVLEDYVKLGAFLPTKPCFLLLNQKQTFLEVDKEQNQLHDLFAEGDYVSFLKQAIAAKKNILISGATSTGKTTFLNACLKEIPLHEHVVTLEDVSEVKPPHELHTSLLTSKGLQGVANVKMQDLVQASLRLRPDRIIMGELRGEEAVDFINASATGHDGSLSSVHAANPEMAFKRLVHMVKLSGIHLSRQAIMDDLHSVIDIVVQLKRRIEGGAFYREVSHIYYKDALQPT